MSALKIVTMLYNKRVLPCGLTNLKPRPLCSYPGEDAEILHATLANLGVQYELIPYYEWNSNNNVLRALQNGTIDLILPTALSTAYRRSYFSFSYPTGESGVVFLTAAPEQSLTANAALLLQVFGGNVWLALLLWVAVFCAMIAGHRYFHYFPRARWIYLAATVFGFSAVLFMNLFTGGLLAQLLNPVTSYKVSDIWHMLTLIESKQIRLLTSRSGLADQMIAYSEHPFYKALRTALKDNPIEYNTSILIGTQGYGNYFVRAVLDGVVPFYKFNDCKVHIIGRKEYLPTYSIGFMTAKESPILSRINGALIRQQAHVAHVTQKYKHLVEGFGRCEKPELKEQPLGMINVSGAFATLFSAAVLCSLCLAAECAISRIRMKREEKKIQPKRKMGMQIQASELIAK